MALLERVSTLLRANLNDLIDKADLLRFLGSDDFTRKDELAGFAHADEARKKIG